MSMAAVSPSHSVKYHQRRERASTAPQRGSREELSVLDVSESVHLELAQAQRRSSSSQAPRHPNLCAMRRLQPGINLCLRHDARWREGFQVAPRSHVRLPLANVESANYSSESGGVTSASRKSSRSNNAVACASSCALCEFVAFKDNRCGRSRVTRTKHNRLTRRPTCTKSPRR